MKQLLTMLMLLVCAFSANAQSCKQWAKQGEWRNGFTEAKPDKTVNLAEFYAQYHKNKAQWDALFKWLAETNLLTIPKGKHPIEGTTLVASVEDSQNQPLEKRNTESHCKKIDFQYVVKGTEGFALLDHASSTIKSLYDEKKDVVRYDYDIRKTHFFNSKPGRFVVFFPSDWHIAKVQTKKKDQNIRVIVIKVDYIE
ncbi:MAG: YhcH/YjgK/YiaL family protein [Prevotella sp.]|nr:YhcH/YjgK/YiaL family protein [Prevotella sp.]